MPTHAQRVASKTTLLGTYFADGVISAKQYRAKLAKIGQIAARAISQKDRARVIAKAGGLCTYCQRMPATTVDHALPVVKGGTGGDENLRAACRYCNADKRALTVDEWREARTAVGDCWPPNWWAAIRSAMEQDFGDGPVGETLTDLANPDVPVSAWWLRLVALLDRPLGQSAETRMLDARLDGLAAEGVCNTLPSPGPKSPS